MKWDKLSQKKITPPYLPINDEVNVKDPDDDESPDGISSWSLFSILFIEIDMIKAKETATGIFGEFQDFIHPELVVQSISSPSMRPLSTPKKVI